MRATLSAIALRAGSWVLGGNFKRHLDDMERAQWLTPGEARRRSDRHLVPLLQHAARHVPFYRDMFRRRGLDPGGVQSAHDLRLFPVLGKADYQAHPFTYFNGENVPEYYFIERATSGSTGQPFRCCLDRRAISIAKASDIFGLSWFGLGPFHRYVRIAAPPPPPPEPARAPVGFRFRHRATQGLKRVYESLGVDRIPVWGVDREQAERIWRRINAFRPDFIIGYTSTLASLAEELMSRKLQLRRPVRAVITFAETLSPPRRRLIEEYFHCPIVNRFGMREFGSCFAQSCEQSADRFHANTEMVICEVLRDDGSPAAAGQVGRLVFTDLHNYARPLIRYFTGDLAVAAGDERCACGRGFPLFGPVEGRSQEVLRTPSGRVISPTVLGHQLFVYHDNLDAVRHFQLVVEGPTRTTLRVVPSARWSDARSQAIAEQLRSLFGNEVEVSIATVPEIPIETTGKRPIIKWTTSRAPVY